ncbi:MAG: DEAD/DEAH box helicase [Candidatus Hermodarchaeota archaeon]
MNQELIQQREYQLKIAKQCVGKNSLVVLPTGLGKTLIAVYVAAKTLELYPNDSKVIVLAPTRPLINQHYESFKRFLTIPEEQFIVLTGKTSPNQRVDLFKSNRLLFYTPQTLRNDIVSKRYSLDSVCLIIFDEAHHSSGDYPYPMISDEYTAQNPDGNILGLTASPGASKDKINELCKALHIDPKNIHTRTRKDEDVKGYLKPLDLYKIGVDLTELMNDAYIVIQHLLEERLQYLSQYGFLETKGQILFNQVIRKDLLRLNIELVKLVKGNGDKTGVYTALSINAQALILFHMIELIEQQGLDVLFNYLKKLKDDARKKSSSKAVKILASDHRLNQVLIELLRYNDLSPEQLIHPKYKVLESILLEQLTQNPNSRVLVFVKLRDSIKNIVSKLEAIKTNVIKPSRFVGQATKSKDDKGLSQKKQLYILNQFKQGDINVLVSSNVGEEGLDIAECDLVIFYDVVASEIRFIQRRGRTGRHREGKVLILYCKNTHDEIYMNIVLSKLKRMNLNLKNNEQSPRVPDLTISSKSVNHVETTPNKAKGDKSKIDYFLNTTPRRSTPLESEVILSTSLPSKFGLRKKFQEAQIAVDVATSKYHIVLFEKVIVQIIQPQVLKTDTLHASPSWLSNLTRIFQLCILVVDFIDFEETFEGEEHLLKTSIMEFGKKHNFQTVSIDNPEELYFIIKNIYDHTKQKRE